MSDIVVRRIVNPTEDEIEQAATVFVAAFHPLDSFGKSLTGGNEEFSIGMARAGVQAAAVGGELWVAGFTPTDICAVATWFGPGTGYMATEEQRAAGWNQVKAKFPPELQKWWTEYFIPRSSAWTASCLGEGTGLGSWHLQLLCTSPEHQKKGLGTALIRAVEPKAVADGVMMCLVATNDRNVAIYRKLGFVVRGTTTIVGSGGEDTMTALSKP